MMNRYVIALNRLKISEEQVKLEGDNQVESHLTIHEVSKLMDKVRKYPVDKIQHEALFSCGFSMN